MHISSGSIFQQTLEYIMEFGFPKNLAYSLDLTAFNAEIHCFNQGKSYIKLELDTQLSARMGYFGKDIDFLQVHAKLEKFGSHLLHREGKNMPLIWMKMYALFRIMKYQI